MFKIDQATAAASLPTPAAPGTQGYFTNGNPASGIPATIVDADFMNMLMMEMMNVVTGGGQTPSKTTYNQMLLAIENLIEARAGNYALDTGVANAYVIALSPAITAYTNGMTVRFRVANANSAASTLNAGGGVVSLLNDVGAALVTGDLPAGTVVSASFDTVANAFLINSLVPSQALSQTAADARYAALAGLSTQLFSVGNATAASHAVNFGQALGLGQTWQNLTASRAAVTVYYNTTGKPIQVSILSSSATPTVNVAGVSIPAGSGTLPTVIVPPGASYSLSTGALTSWFEMR